MTIDYNNPHVLKICWVQIDEGTSWILKSAAKARCVALAFPHYLEPSKSNRRQRKISLVKWAVLGAFITPTLFSEYDLRETERFRVERSCKVLLQIRSYLGLSDANSNVQFLRPIIIMPRAGHRTFPGKDSIDGRQFFRT